MNQNNIKPEKITKPIQLLAVWLVGLIILVSALITGAATIKSPEWLPVFFSISSVSIIPVFLVLIFLLQTKFRPQMQEDEYYAKYLNSNTLEKKISTNEIIISDLTQKIDNKLIELTSITKSSIVEINKNLQNILIDNGELPIENTLKFNEERFENFIDNTKTQININLKLPRFNEILLNLSNNNIKVDSFFGEHNYQEIPSIFLISFGSNVSLVQLKTIINSLIEFGLSNLQVINIDLESNVIYIGSYAYKSTHLNQITNITPKILEKINNSEAVIEIVEIVEKNKKNF